MNERETIRLDLPATYQELAVLGACLEAYIQRVDNLQDAKVTSYNIQLAVNEIFANIVGHAYENIADGRVSVTIAFGGEPRQIVIDLTDRGASFDPSIVPPPPEDDVQVNGYGLFLVEQLLDEVVYQPLPGGNSWRLVKYV